MPMLEKPDLQDERLVTCLQDEYGLIVSQVAFLPLGADQNTAVFRVLAEDGTPYFVKLRLGAFNQIAVVLPKCLSEQGIGQIIAPLSARNAQLWVHLEAFTLILYPFIEGRDGYEISLTDRQWIDFGKVIYPEAKVWDASTGELSLPPLRIGNQPLRTVMWSLDGRFLVARSDENVARVWDAATGEAVTPLLKHNGYVLLAHLVANNRLMTLSPPNLMRAWDLLETKLGADVISDYGKLVAGRRLSPAGVLVPLRPDEMVTLQRSLRTRAPELFE